MHLTAEDSGRIVAWGPPDNPCIVRVLSVYRTGYNPSISYESWDGHSEILIEDMWSTLDDYSKNWRPATEEETAEFLRLYTPAPQNWN